ncbi:MAG: hypothetical protein BWY42_01613 [Candidatus Omnitrophica bacterium ADurb.Bin277]|nr:MAG: hypothetical protein BWY42_01613 [Candidatus Omnitrophica bacterium ADurb.Bin277]
MFEEVAVRNNPFLDGRVLYAHDHGDPNKEIMAVYPDRVYYIGSFDRNGIRPHLKLIERA